MAALSQTQRGSFSMHTTSSTRRSSGIRIPAWALTKRFQAGSPDSTAKRTVQTLPSVEDDNDSLALPKMEPNQLSTTSANSDLATVLQMDVTGFSLDHLHVDLDLEAKRVCLAGKGPRMQLFKRSFPILNANSLQLQDMKATVVASDQDDRKLLRLQAPTKKATGTASATSTATEGQRKINIPIQDETRPPTMIQIRH